MYNYCEKKKWSLSCVVTTCKVFSFFSKGGRKEWIWKKKLGFWNAVLWSQETSLQFRRLKSFSSSKHFNAQSIQEKLWAKFCDICRFVCVFIFNLWSKCHNGFQLKSNLPINIISAAVFFFAFGISFGSYFYRL